MRRSGKDVNTLPAYWNFILKTFSSLECNFFRQVHLPTTSIHPVSLPKIAKTSKCLTNRLSCYTWILVKLGISSAHHNRKAWVQSWYSKKYTGWIKYTWKREITLSTYQRNQNCLHPVDNNRKMHKELGFQLLSVFLFLYGYSTCSMATKLVWVRFISKIKDSMRVLQ